MSPSTSQASGSCGIAAVAAAAAAASRRSRSPSLDRACHSHESRRASAPSVAPMRQVLRPPSGIVVMAEAASAAAAAVVAAAARSARAADSRTPASGAPSHPRSRSAAANCSPSWWPSFASSRLRPATSGSSTASWSYSNARSTSRAPTSAPLQNTFQLPVVPSSSTAGPLRSANTATAT